LRGGRDKEGEHARGFENELREREKYRGTSLFLEVGRMWSAASSRGVKKKGGKSGKRLEELGGGGLLMRGSNNTKLERGLQKKYSILIKNKRHKTQKKKVKETT